MHVICISGYYLPSGGAALGPRHLAPMLPFAAMTVALGLMRWPRVGCYLGYLSILLTGFATGLEAMPPDGQANPLVNVHLSRLWEGAFVHNIGSILGWPPFVIAPLVAALLLVPYGALCLTAEGSEDPDARSGAFSSEVTSGLQD